MTVAPLSVRPRERTHARSLRSNLPDEPLARLHGLLEESRTGRASGENTEAALKKLAAKAIGDNRPWRLAEVATILVLADLAAQGWTFAVARGAVWMTPPNGKARPGETPASVKERLRAPMRAARKRQLEEPSVRKFLASMHSPRRRGPHAWRATSIADVIDDGAALAEQLAEIAAMPLEKREAELAGLVDPVVELVTPDGWCTHTGLLLRDVWRYFRHTWSLEYRPTPGRNAQFLIRNAARPNAPVMGIASLTNPVLQLEDRDNWIGWTYAAVIRRIEREPGFWPILRDVLLRVLESAKGEIRHDDLIEALGVSEGNALEQNLAAFGHAAAREREAALKRPAVLNGGAQPSAKVLPRDEAGAIDWAAASLTPLFRGKRARALAEVLTAIRGLARAPATGVEALDALRTDAEMERALRLSLRELRKRGLASRILEVNVCGAVPPYRELLGGKLTALALASREVRDHYREKYRTVPGEIASKMAGRPIVRENDVCVLTTTSLYGIGSSQYNRLRIALDGGEVRWNRIGETRGFGTIHFRNETIQALRALSIAKRGHRLATNLRLPAAREGSAGVRGVSRWGVAARKSGKKCACRGTRKILSH